MSYGQSLTDAHRQIGVEIVWRPVSWGYDLVERSLVRADETMNIQEIMNPAVHPGYETPSIFAVICDNYFIEAGGHADLLFGRMVPTGISTDVPDCLLRTVRYALACLIVAPRWGYDEPKILSYAISPFCPTSADGLHVSKKEIP